MRIITSSRSALELRPRLRGALLLSFILGWSGCGSTPTSEDPQSGEGGSKATGGASGKGGGSGGASASGGAGGGLGGNPGSGGGGGGSAGSGGGPGASGGSGGMQASGGVSGDAAALDVAGGSGGAGGSSPDATGAPGDAPPSVPRPDAMGAACANGGNYAFTIRSFPSQKGTFTAYFTANPGKSPTNSVIGLSDGMKYLHDDFSAIIRFGTSGMLDARNGTAYTSLTPITYKETDYHFRLVVDVPAKTYAAYVTFDGMPEITIGTNLAFRDSAPTPAQLNYWGVEAIAGHTTKVCGFLTVP
jgi:hypothetical protein